MDPVIDPVLNRLEAEKATAEAAELVRPPNGLLRGGNEVVRPWAADELIVHDGPIPPTLNESTPSPLPRVRAKAAMSSLTGDEDCP